MESPPKEIDNIINKNESDEEKERTGEHVLKCAEYLDGIPRKDKAKVLRAYQELFSRNCPADIGESFCYYDD